MSHQTIYLKNDRHELAKLVKRTDEFAEKNGLSESVRADLQIALEEVVLNVIIHGYGEGGEEGEVIVSLNADGQFVTAVVTDEAQAYDPLCRPEVDVGLPGDERAIGGLGVHFVKKLVDSAYYERRGESNVLTMRFRRNRAQ